MSVGVLHVSRSMSVGVLHVSSTTSCQQEYFMSVGVLHVSRSTTSCQQYYFMSVGVLHVSRSTSCQQEYYFMSVGVLHVSRSTTSCQQGYFMSVGVLLHDSSSIIILRPLATQALEMTPLHSSRSSMPELSSSGLPEIPKGHDCWEVSVSHSFDDPSQSQDLPDGRPLLSRVLLLRSPHGVQHRPKAVEKSSQVKSMLFVQPLITVTVSKVFTGESSC